MAEIRANGVPEEFCRRVNVARAKRGMSMKDATIEALEGWMGAEPRLVAVPDAPPYPKGHESLHERLELALKQGPSARKAVESLLDWALKEPSGETRGRRRAGPPRTAVNQ